ncbi:MAG TPA: hypothetical protein VI278_05275 [Nitrososphaeraceae archaeon]
MWTIRCNAIRLIESVGCYYPDINTDYNKKRIKQIKKIVAGLLEKKNQKQGIREEDANKLSKLPYAKRMNLL